jgi:hypothetical protein
MDVGRESDNDDAIDGKLNPIDQENGDDDVQYGYCRSQRRTSYEYRVFFQPWVREGFRSPRGEPT